MSRAAHRGGGGVDPRLAAPFEAGVAHLQAERFSQACALLAPVAAAAPGEPDIRRAYAEALIGTGELARAEVEARAALAADKRRPAAHVCLGDVLALSGQAGEAEKAWRSALALDRRYAPAALRLARALLTQGRPREAAQVTTPLAAAASAGADVLETHAEALKLLGRKAESLDAYRRTRDAAPQSAIAWHNYAALLADTRADAEALEAIERVFALGMDRGETWLVRAHALQGLNRYDEAQAAYRECLARLPGEPIAVDDLAKLIWMRTADLAAADAVYAEVERAGAGSAATRIGRAWLHDFAGDPAAGLAALKPATDTGDASAHAVAARIAGRLDPDLAARHADAAAALRPDDRQTPLMLAEARLAQGRAQEAAAEAERVLAAEPLDQHALAVRAAAWRITGDPRLPALYDYAAFVGAYTIDTPPGWPDLSAYLADLAAALKRLHALRTHPVGQSLRQGTQTSGELRRSDDPAIRAFFAAIDAPIRAHIAKLGRGRDPLRARNTRPLRPGRRLVGAVAAGRAPRGPHSPRRLAFLRLLRRASAGGGRGRARGLDQVRRARRAHRRRAPARRALGPARARTAGAVPLLHVARHRAFRRRGVAAHHGLRRGSRVSGAPLAVFDVDGTLVDSRASIQAAMSRAFEGAGLAPPAYEATRRIVGLSLPQAMASIAPEADAALQARLVDGYRAAWGELHAAPGFHEPLYPGASDLLAHLAADGWRLAMATGKGRRGVDVVIRMHGWEGVFASTHCADDGPGKPHPAMLHAALEAAGAAPADAVMIGDTAFDMAMARAADVRALGVGWGFHTEAEVRDGGADQLSRDFSDLTAELDRFAASTRRAPVPI